jgi:hypothetical protein
LSWGDFFFPSFSEKTHFLYKENCSFSVSFLK